MEKEDWKDHLRAYFESIDILEKSKFETIENFKQFCEFIAEPAFEALAAELKKYGVKSKCWILQGKSVKLQLYLPRSKVENFLYAISLPKNSVELKLRMSFGGRKTPTGPWETKDGPFMEKVPANRILKITKEELIEDIIEHYRDFTYTALTSPD